MHKTKETRRAEAAERLARCAAMTPAQRLHNLDRRYGKGVGGFKERQRLLRLLESEKLAEKNRDDR